jgi:branched-chain amino acid transport system substrate-binding protein
MMKGLFPERRAAVGVATLSVVILALAVVTAGADAKKPSLSPIVIGNVGTYSGTFAAGRHGIREGLSAWSRYINANGGINGHPIVVKTEDDGGDPSKAQTLVQSMISNDHVVAFLQNSSTVTQSWQNLPIQAGVPSINANTLGQAGQFNAGTTATDYSNSYVISSHTLGANSFAFVYCAELTVCSQAKDKAGQVAAQLGVKFSSYAVSSSQPNYTAVCLSIKSDGTQAVQLGVNPATIVRVADECARQGVHTQYVMGSTATQKLIEDDSNIEGGLVPLFDFPWFQKNTPATHTFQFALGRFAPKLTHDRLNYNAQLSATWSVGQVFAAAARNATKTGNKATPASIIKGLFAIPANSTFGGLTPPLTFKPTAPFTDLATYVQPPSRCFFLIQLHNHDWAAPKGVNKFGQICPKG